MEREPIPCGCCEKLYQSSSMRMSVTVGPAPDYGVTFNYWLCKDCEDRGLMWAARESLRTARTVYLVMAGEGYPFTRPVAAFTDKADAEQAVANGMGGDIDECDLNGPTALAPPSPES